MNEEVEVEVLDCPDTLKLYFKEKPAKVTWKLEQQENPAVLINGVPQVQNFGILLCPACKEIVNVLQNPNLTSDDAVIAICNSNIAQLESQALYCPHCGQKLSYNIESRVVDEIHLNQ